MTDKTKLEQRIDQLNQESAALQRQMASHRQRITEIDTEYKAAQQRYDLQGDDSAGAELATLRTERQRLEAEIASYTQQAAEYPGRITAIRNEIAGIDHRENLRQLATDRQTLLEAFSEYEQALYTCLETYQRFAQLHQGAQTLFRQCENYARANNTPIPPKVGSVSIIPERWWFDAHAETGIERRMSQARQQLAG